MSQLSNAFPPWGDTGQKPPDNKDYQGGEQVNEKHFDYLWDNLKGSFDDVYAHLKFDSVEAANSGVVRDGNAKILYRTQVPNGSSMKVTQASLTKDGASAVPSNCDMALAVIRTSSGSLGSKTTLISGDGNTVHVDQTGTPLGKYDNTSGGNETVAVVVDNGNYNAGSGDDVTHAATVKGRVE